MSEKAAEVLADDFREVADALLAAHDSGELLTCVQDSPDGFKVCFMSSWKQGIVMIPSMAMADQNS